ncbi:PilZ domain-containing protein [Sphingomonas sp. EC-HK361]|nr:PilZ domain-containing protein [Sphingomonas sp. EC-HK361]
MGAMDPEHPFGKLPASVRAGRERGRDSLFLMAKFRRAGEKAHVAVRVRNLSEGGLMAELPEALDIDEAVEVEVRGLGWVKGRIAWHAEGRTGIAFDRLVDPQLARKPVTGGTMTPSYVKPIIIKG